MERRRQWPPCCFVLANALAMAQPRMNIFRWQMETGKVIRRLCPGLSESDDHVIRPDVKPVSLVYYPGFARLTL